MKFGLKLSSPTVLKLCGWLLVLICLGLGVLTGWALPYVLAWLRLNVALAVFGFIGLGLILAGWALMPRGRT